MLQCQYGHDKVDFKPRLKGEKNLRRLYRIQVQGFYLNTFFKFKRLFNLSINTTQSIRNIVISIEQ